VTGRDLIYELPLHRRQIVGFQRFRLFLDTVRIDRGLGAETVVVRQAGVVDHERRRFAAMATHRSFLAIDFHRYGDPGRNRQSAMEAGSRHVLFRRCPVHIRIYRCRILQHCARAISHLHVSPSCANPDRRLLMHVSY